MEVERPTAEMLDGHKVDGLDGRGGGDAGAERPSTGEPHQRQEEDDDDDALVGESVSSEGDEEDSVDSDLISDGEFCVDMDMVDDVTNDEGFELGEVRLLPDAR